jgi:hypothetical protein
MQLKENTRYRLRNGMEVGPLKLRGENFWTYFHLDRESFLALIPMWTDDGRYDSYTDLEDNDPQFDIVEEI